ncbi:FANCM [Acanthosepion pharaonis]|uniref:FANCM n=1 Tax=Acanthosepion pharaonis TaxID=158019 RepID=A0A812E2C4_ACAPH|nr:FANCM [Sepia pharaonis]
MAPTKPLVTQQIEACYNIMGIPQLDIAEMTGKMLPVARQKSWKEKRVIFLTPQVLINDLSRGTCQADKIKCLVIDEAHKSLGNYAYCQVVQELVKTTRDFRVLALSATPGSNLTMVQDVITNLLISHIELRTDDSSEIKMYSFERKVEKIVVPLGEELKSVEAQYVELLESVVNRLLKQKVLYRQNIKSLSKFIILKCRDEFRQNPPHFLQHAQLGVIEGDFALAISLYHGYELLQLHGLRSFYQYLQSLVNREKGYGRTRSELMKNVNFVNIYDYLSNRFGEKPSITFSQQTTQEKTEQYVIGHPKLEKLQEIVLEHFRKFQKEDGSSDTRVMIFSQYRNSVSDITEMLKRQQPLVKVISFMGQAIKKETKGFTQKEQLRVMKLFREGNYNTLVSTCVGEEGLDIGDVDLIICFDASKSPIRLVQRMGRTGRKRDGRIVMLVTEGKEDMIYKRSQYNKNSITKALLNGTKSLHYYQHNPRMLPDGLMPQCHKMYITIKKEFETLDQAKALKKKEKKTKIAKGKIKKIPDLFTDENSTDGRLTPISNSNSSVQSSEFQPGLDNGDNVRASSPPTYELLSDDELPDLSPEKKISQPKKALFTSLQRNCQVSDVSSPDLSDANNLSHHKRKLSVETVGSLKLSKLHDLKSSAEEKNEKTQSDPFGVDYQGTAKSLKSKSFTEPDNDDSKLVTSYGDLFADFSQSFDHAAEIEDNSHLLPEKTENGHSGTQNQTPDVSVHENSRFSDNLFNEAILHEDDRPVFDLTTDMFSDDESADDTGQKYGAVKTHATNLKCNSTTSSETTSYRTHDLAPSPVALEKNCNSSKLSSLIVSFVNTKFQTSAANGDTCKNDDDDDDDNLPLFDLGLDFDALPPTPDHRNPCSSKTSQSNQECSTPILLQNIALSTPEYGSRGEKSSAVKDMHISSSSDEELGGFRCVLPTLNVIEHLQQSTPSSKKKSTPAAADLFSARFSANEVTSPLHENKGESSPSLCASQGFDLKFDELLDDEQLDGWEVAVQPKDEECKSIILIYNFKLNWKML